MHYFIKEKHPRDLKEIDKLRKDVHNILAEFSRKISQQNRSEQGAKTQAILMSLFRTAELQGNDPVESIFEFGDEAPAMLFRLGYSSSPSARSSRMEPEILFK